MKTLLKSTLVVFATLAVLAGTSVAYFTSNVQATGNVVQTGTLRSAIYSADDTNFWWVAYNDGTSTVLGTPMPAITNMAPGDTKTVYYAVANHTSGSLPFKYRQYYTGVWSNSGNPALMTLNIGRVAQAGAGCAAVTACNNLRNSMIAAGYTEAAGGWYSTSVGAFNTGYYGGSEVLAASANHEFTIYEMDMTLNGPSTDDTYQGQTFTYAVNLESTQTPTGAW